MDYTNRHIIERMTHYGMGTTAECRALLGTLTLCILDVLDDLEKGDGLHVEHLGTLGVQLEPQVWKYMPMLRMKFCRSRPTRWQYVFNPCARVKGDQLRRYPDEVYPPLVPKTQSQPVTDVLPKTANDGDSQDST